MKVFISWSGEKSQKYAEAIKDWLPSVIQSVRPYFSSTDIDKGIRWSSDLSKELDASMVGLICLTRNNISEPWINFEAGALSKKLDNSRVCPILFDIQSSDVSGPLSQFQATKVDKADFKKLIEMINSQCGEARLTVETLSLVFEKWWPDLEKRFKEISSIKEEVSSSVRSDRDILEEILELNRRNLRRGPVQGINPFAINDLRDRFKLLRTFSEGLEDEELLNIVQKLSLPVNHIVNKHSVKGGEETSNE